MIEDFTFDTDASPANMNNIIKNINKNEEDITAVKESVEEVGSQIGQLSNPNLLINGDFQVWQRGLSFPLSNAYTYTADRWRAQKGVASTGNVTKHYNSLRVETTSGALILRQYVEGNFLGKTLTLSIRVNGETLVCTGSVKTSIPVVTKLTDDGVASAYFIEENGFLVAGVNIYVGVAVIDWIKLELGEIATPLSPRSYGEELLLCQRYYEKSYSMDIIPGSTSVGGIEAKIIPSNSIPITQKYGKTSFKVAKRVSPTVTIYPYTTPSNIGRVSNHSGQDLGEGSGTPFMIGTDGFTVYNRDTPQTTIGVMVMYHWTAECEIY